MTKNEFPSGWDETRVAKVLSHYEKQTDEEAIMEDETGAEEHDTMMSVPRSLVPAVRELIAKHQR